MRTVLRSLSSRLTERIVVERLTLTENENGFEEEAWQSIFNGYAEFNPMTGREFIKANAENTEHIASFIVRYSKNTLLITEKDRLIHKGKVYNIKYVHDIENAHKEIELKVVSFNG